MAQHGTGTVYMEKLPSMSQPPSSSDRLLSPGEAVNWTLLPSGSRGGPSLLGPDHGLLGWSAEARSHKDLGDNLVFKQVYGPGRGKILG